MKKILSMILIISIIMTIFIVPSYAVENPWDHRNYGMIFRLSNGVLYYCDHVSYGENYAYLTTDNYYILQFANSSTTLAYNTYKKAMYVYFQDNTYSTHTTIDELEYFEMTEQFSNNPLENHLIYEEWKAEYLNDHSIAQLISFQKDRLLEELGLGFVVDWKNEKIDKLKSALKVAGETLTNAVENACIYTVLKVASLFDNPMDEYKQDESNGVTDTYNTVLEVDTYIEKSYDVDNNINYNVTIYNHNTGVVINNYTTTPVLNQTTQEYEIPHEIPGNVLPEYRGIYRTDSYQVAYPTGLVINVGNPYVPKQTPSYKSSSPISTGRYAIGTPQEIEKAQEGYTGESEGECTITNITDGASYSYKPSLQINNTSENYYTLWVNGKNVHTINKKGNQTVPNTVTKFVIGTNSIELKDEDDTVIEAYTITITNTPINDDGTGNVPKDKPEKPVTGDAVDWLGYIVDIIGYVIELIFSSIGKMLDILITSLGNLGSSFQGVAEFFRSLFSFIPTEIMTVITAFLTIFLILKLVEKFGGK